MPTLAQLVRAAGAGDDTAFQRLLEHEFRSAYGVAFAISGSHADAQDAVQEAAFRAWREMHHLRDPNAWSAWFHRIVVNVAIQLSRKAARRRQLTRPVAADVPDRSASLGEADEIQQALWLLKPDERALIALRYGRDLEVPDVARLMGIRLGTAKSRLHRALAKLRIALEDGGP